MEDEIIFLKLSRAAQLMCNSNKIKMDLESLGANSCEGHTSELLLKAHFLSCKGGGDFVSSTTVKRQWRLGKREDGKRRV